MDSPQISPALEKRMHNYDTEAAVIHRKLSNPDVPEGKKEKLRFRLNEIVRRLIPEISLEAENSS